MELDSRGVRSSSKVWVGGEGRGADNQVEK